MIVGYCFCFTLSLIQVGLTVMVVTERVVLRVHVYHFYSGYSDYINMSRWQNFPNSEQEQIYLASTTTTSTTTGIVSIRKHVGELIKQEIAEHNHALCYYRNISGDSPIAYICELGCCPHGCCNASEHQEYNSGYGWAIALLVAFILVTVLIVIAMLSLYLLNKHNNQKQREQFTESSAHSSTASQISGPTYYPQDAYYPYVPNTKTF